MTTSASMRVTSGHLTTSGRCRIDVVDTADDLVVLKVRGAEVSVELALAGAHLEELLEALLACTVPDSLPPQLAVVS